MTTPRRRELEELPNWPRYLLRAEAAAYLGVSVDVFDLEIARKIWPQGVQRPIGGHDKRGRLTWDRDLLDMSANAIARQGLSR